jgi:DNA-binding MarR family transcriptional regulator
MNKTSSSTSRKELIDLLNQQSRELSNRTVLFHHWISELLGLNTIDHKCLDLIVRADSSITGAQLANITGLSSGAITGVIDRLEKAGYVVRERDKKDRRLVYIKPVMQKIEKDIGPIFESLQEIMTKIYSRYSDKELASILDATTKINQIMNERTLDIMKSISQRKIQKKNTN